MAIPDFQSIMLPFLKLIGDGKEHSIREMIDKLSLHFHLTEDEKKQLLASGLQPVFENRVGWTRTHLKKAGLLESPRRSIIRITDRGKDLLKSNPSLVNMSLLKQYPEYLEFIGATSPSTDQNTTIELTENKNTPQDTLDYAYQKLRKTLAQDLLVKIKAMPASFFEGLVVKLLVKMGYGGSLKDAGSQTRLTKDEGIDGVIKEDKLGLDIIYIQAKRWDNTTIGRPEIQKFVGALAGQGAKKGVFITTSTFTADAREYVPRNETKIVLIDGVELAQYMIDYNLGVSVKSTYELKEIDSDFFDAE
ncbi:MAG: restriction endonuclease [Sporocytophaga sp.]|nr:restriction endonuclease [Sporocytophaga sp.]